MNLNRMRYRSIQADFGIALTRVLGTAWVLRVVLLHPGLLLSHQKTLFTHLVILVYHIFPHLCTIVVERNKVKWINGIKACQMGNEATQTWRSCGNIDIQIPTCCVFIRKQTLYIV